MIFESSGPTAASEIIDNLIAPNSSEVTNSIFKKAIDIQKILNDPKQIVNVEWTQGQSLGNLAYEYIGDSFAWQAVAAVNGLDPLQQVDIGKVLQVPTRKAIEEGIKKLVVNSPDIQKTITSIKGSILDLTGVGAANTPFANNLKDCVNKLIDFKIATN